MLESINLEETIAKVPDYPKPGILSMIFRHSTEYKSIDSNREETSS